MSDHHPDAANLIVDAVHDHLTFRLGECPDTDDSVACDMSGDAVLDALAAAGLAVVRVGDVPPWMEFAGAYDDPDQVRIRYEDEDCDHDFEECGVCRPLYVVRRDGP